MNITRIGIFFTRKQLLDYLYMLDSRIKYKKQAKNFDQEYERCLAMRLQVVEALAERL